mmetsp:Transcript_153714/g.492821  ORF Transcript_153714/g.492821 Transcript_153714/m.492821 type:complete len:314 (+) Transcript_153714:143-1084(+)
MSKGFTLVAYAPPSSPTGSPAARAERRAAASWGAPFVSETPPAPTAAAGGVAAAAAALPEEAWSKTLQVASSVLSKASCVCPACKPSKKALLKQAAMPRFRARRAQTSAWLKPPPSATTRNTFGCSTSGRYKSSSQGMVSLKMTRSSGPKLLKLSNNTSKRSCSHLAFSGQPTATSGSSTGTKPRARTWRARSNCWWTKALMPSTLGLLIRERVLVPKMPAAAAESRTASSCGTSLMSCTPPRSSKSPRSTFRKGTTLFVSQRYLAAGRPQISCSTVSSKRIAPSTRGPPNVGLDKMRERMAWARSSISGSPK